MSRTYRLNTDGCGCCSWHYTTDVVGELLMPDGKTILLLKDQHGDKTWWYDPDLEIGHEID